MFDDDVDLRNYLRDRTQHLIDKLLPYADHYKGQPLEYTFRHTLSTWLMEMFRAKVISPGECLELMRVCDPHFYETILFQISIVEEIKKAKNEKTE